MRTILHNDWQEVIGEEFEKDYYKQIRGFLKKEYSEKVVYPNMDDIFSALHFTSYEDVKVVIIGQDPYHGENQAHGLCFSVQKGVKIPPSLRNIYKELNSDLGCSIPSHGYLEKWANQGVLMINATLTVQAGLAASHSKIGWQKFTDKIIEKVNEKDTPVVFILWGNYAKSKKKMIDMSKHYVIESVHPSPLSASRGFFGSKPFSQTNEFLIGNGLEPIDWQIDDL